MWLCITYVHINAWQREHFGVRQLLRYEPEELLSPLVPFHRVQQIVLQVVVALECHCITRRYGRRDRDGHIAKSTHTCKKSSINRSGALIFVLLLKCHSASAVIVVVVVMELIMLLFIFRVGGWAWPPHQYSSSSGGGWEVLYV